MQLLHGHNNILASVKDLYLIGSAKNMSIKEGSTHAIDAKDKSSNGSLMMNPVASGDNVATGLASAHRLKEELPPLVPCCEGRELQISEDLVRSGLSAISVKHDGVIQSLSLSHATEMMQMAPGLVKHRNSFRCLHRPDLKRVPYLRRMTPDELETLFRGYSDFPTRVKNSNLKEDVARVSIPPDENMRTRDLKEKQAVNQEEGTCCPGATSLHPIPEMRSHLEDVPAGMRLHGARARLYTSVLAGATAGDQLDGIIDSENHDLRIPDEATVDEEVQLSEELQIILPPPARPAHAT